MALTEFVMGKKTLKRGSGLTARNRHRIVFWVGVAQFGENVISVRLQKSCYSTYKI